MQLQVPQRWLQRQATSFVGIALILAMSISLAWQSADWLRLLRAPVAASSNSTSEAPAAVVNPEIGQLFGTSNAVSDGPAPSTNLRLTLLGSFVHADPQRSTAIILSEGSTAQRYSVNSEISSGVRLHSVAADRVELLRNGRRESLSFPLNSSTAGSLQSNTQEVMADPLEQLSEMESDDLSQLRERMDALRQQMQDSGSMPETAEPTEQPMEEN
ncbi:type II secretion system protein N [Pseudomonas anguilliseptica]|uniref:type II secretion system protein N n=1 Tax=Pseudomonas anguilliseptica TaxID=53406 RepID=UPI0022AF273B|nr:type II secretion system protein N [Pseudomonas anguilliseptica]MCZ4323921.1 secretion protein XcpP [Pseudomonas anguilliseptica]